MINGCIGNPVILTAIVSEKFFSLSPLLRTPPMLKNVGFSPLLGFCSSTQLLNVNKINVHKQNSLIVCHIVLIIFFVFSSSFFAVDDVVFAQYAFCFIIFVNIYSNCYVLKLLHFRLILNICVMYYFSVDAGLLFGCLGTQKKLSGPSTFTTVLFPSRLALFSFRPSQALARKRTMAWFS